MTQVSVIIPAYNATGTLDRTLASVRAQTHGDLEIIVVDDGSTDKTAELAARHAKEDPRIQIVSIANGGVAAARNHGIELAKNDWVAPVDADDVWHPETVAGFLAAAEAAPEPVVFVYTWSRRIDADDHLITDLGRPRYRGDVLGQILAANFTRNASASMLNRAAVLQVGGYDAGFQAVGAHGAEDIDLYLRLATVGPVAVAEGYHVGYRQMPGSMSQSADRMRQSIELALEKLEKNQLSIRPELFDLARTNYDLYAGGLSLASGKWGDLLRYCGKALWRNPAMALVHLAVFGPYSLLLKVRRHAMPKFGALKPKEAITMPLPDVVMGAQDRLYRAHLAAPMDGPR